MGETRHPAGGDLDLGSRGELADRQHMDAAQDLLVQDGGQAVGDRGLVGLAGHAAAPRSGDEQPFSDTRLKREKRRNNGNRECQHRFDRMVLRVAEDASRRNHDDAAADLDLHRCRRQEDLSPVLPFSLHESRKRIIHPGHGRCRHLWTP